MRQVHVGARRDRHRRRIAVGSSRRAVAAALIIGLVAVVPAPLPASAEHGAGAWTISTVAGTTFGFSGDGGPATAAQIRHPADVAKDASGNLYLSESSGHRVRKVDPTGIITTVVGTGVAGFGGDGGPATAARLNYPAGLAVDSAGNLYIADSQNAVVRKVDAAGTITTVAGIPEAPWFGGDGGQATTAQLDGPASVWFGPTGVMYIADRNNQRIRKVDTAGIISTVAGTGGAGFSGDGGPAIAAQFNFPEDVSGDNAGNLYVADFFNNRIRKVDTSSGIITTVAGNGTYGYGGDGGPATSAQLKQPHGVDVQGSGNLFIADYDNSAIRRVDATGTIDTVAGNGTSGVSGDGGDATSAALNHPRRLTLDRSGHLYIADTDNSRVRLVEASLLRITAAPKLPKVGDTLTYTLTISSPPTTATGVALSATLPAELSYAGAVPSQGSCFHSAGTLSCQLGTVQPGAAATVKLTTTATTAGVVPLTATFSADDPTTVPGLRTVTTSTKVSGAQCGTTVSTNMVLSADVGPCAGNGLIIGKGRVKLDLGGHTVFGFPGPGDGTAAGIRLPARRSVTISNGTVRDFDAGVVINGGRSNIVRNLQILDNVGPDDPVTAELGDGIFVSNSVGNQILDNTLLGNGRYDGIGILGETADGNIVRGNRVENTLAVTNYFLGGPTGQGIILNGANDGTGGNTIGTITGSVVSNNTVRNNASGGLANINIVKSEISGNTVEANGLTGRAGNGIGLQLGPRLRTDITDVLIQNNQVHGNSQAGITVSSNGNRILNNDAADNAVQPQNSIPGMWDLHDAKANCGKNVWSGNAWGSGGYSQACTTTGGSGPASAALSQSSGGTGGPSAASADPPLPPARRFPPGA